MIVDGNTYCRVITPVLPTEYQEVEYIESTGTQYIDTNKTLTTTTSLTANVAFTNNTVLSQVNGLWGGPNKNYRLQFGINNGSYFWIGIGDKNYTTTTHIDTNKHTFDIDLLNKKYGIDGNLISVGLILTSDVTNNIYLFAFNHVNNGTPYYYCYQKVYSCKLYDNNILVRNFIPCYRKSDNEIGMYDTVNKVFYTNQGTGTFLKGNNVVHTIRYKIPTEERPYISGHVIDGSSTFTFTVNGNQSITVPVDSDGNWKWYVDRTITSLFRMLCPTATTYADNIDELEINANLENCTNFGVAIALTPLTRVVVKKQTAKLTDISYLAQDCEDLKEFIAPFLILGDGSNIGSMFLRCSSLEVVDLQRAQINTAGSSTMFSGCKKLKTINVEAIKANLKLHWSPVLTKQSIVNLLNAAAANVTYTLHSTVYNKCASGGEWYSDIQAAIDAKALEGYTVTLISA